MTAQMTSLVEKSSKFVNEKAMDDALSKAETKILTEYKKLIDDVKNIENKHMEVVQKSGGKQVKTFFTFLIL